jgi:hypothetical protein
MSQIHFINKTGVVCDGQVIIEIKAQQDVPDYVHGVTSQKAAILRLK